jgi:hypothetical protein
VSLRIAHAIQSLIVDAKKHSGHRPRKTTPGPRLRGDDDGGSGYTRGQVSLRIATSFAVGRRNETKRPPATIDTGSPHARGTTMQGAAVRVVNCRCANEPRPIAKPQSPMCTPATTAHGLRAGFQQIAREPQMLPSSFPRRREPSVVDGFT